MKKAVAVMKCKPSKKWLKEIESVYRSMGLNPEQLKHFNALNTLSKQTKQNRPIVFTESGTTSDRDEEFQNGELE